MVMGTLLWVLAALPVAPAPAGTTAPLPAAEPVKGAVVGKAVVTCVGRLNEVLAHAHPLQEDAVFRGVSCSVSNWSPVRWHVAYGAFWVSADGRLFPGTIPLPDSEPLSRYDLPSLLKGKAVDQPGVPVRPGATSFAGNPPAAGARLRAYKAETEHRFAIHYDYLPAGGLRVRQFVLTDAPSADAGAGHIREGPGGRGMWPWSFTTHRYEGKWDKAGRKWERRPWAQEESIEVGFREPFQVLGRGQDYYFVTRSGKLFRAPKPAGGGARKLGAVWADPKRPVTAFITDADTGRAFLFVPPKGKGGRPAFFELAPEPELVEYDPRAVRLPPYDEPHRTALHLARILWSLKKVAAK
jgi:hypothetical protein